MGGTFPGRAGVPKAGHFPTTSHRMPMNGMATSKSENATLNSARSLGAPFATCYYMKPNMASGTRATPRTCLARSSIRKKLRAANASRIPHRIGMYIYPRQSAHRWRRAVKKSTPLRNPSSRFQLCSLCHLLRSPQISEIGVISDLRTVESCNCGNDTYNYYTRPTLAALGCSAEMI